MHKRFLKCALAILLSLCLLLSTTGIAFANDGSTDMTAVSTYAMQEVSSAYEGISWIDVRNTDSPLEVYGLHDYADNTQNVNGTFVRMDHDIATSVTSESKTAFPEDVSTITSSFYGGNVWLHNQEPTGARVRFSTDSKSVALQVYAPIAAIWGTKAYNLVFDLYVDTENGSEYYGSFSPDTSLSGLNVFYEDIIEFDTAEQRSITIYFCYLNPISDVYVGLDSEGSVGKNAYPYEEGGKIVWFGSSITQGGVVTRPGKTFAAIVSRETNTDFLNLGYWGSAVGQTAIAEEIARQVEAGEVRAFILDYDHNESNASTLKSRHWAFYQTVRAANADIPIVMVSRPNHSADTWDALRTAIRENYEAALADGDTNVFFVDGQTFWTGHDHTTNSKGCSICLQHLRDGVHPNDDGAQKIANKILGLFKDMESGWNEGITIYENDFSDANTASDWTIPSDATAFTIADGKMTFDVTGESKKYNLTQSAEWDNYSVSATVNMSSDTNRNLFGIYARGGTVRMLLRQTTAGSENLRLRVYTQGNTYYESGDVYKIDTDYTLKIMAKGAEIKYFINDNEVFTSETKVAAASSGAAGVETFCGTDRRTVATVDNFTVKALGSAGDPQGIIVPPVILAQVGETLPAFDLRVDYGIYGTKKISSTDEGVTVTADTSVEAITTYTVTYEGFSASGTMYVLEDKSQAYADSFDSLNTNAWTPSTNVTVANGVMTITNGNAKLDKLTGATEWTDYILECDITTHAQEASTTLKQTTCVVSVRNQSGTNGYEYGPIMTNSTLSGTGYRLYERGSASVNSTYTKYTPTPGVTDHIRIEVSGDNIKFYLLKNGEYILTHEVTDAVYDSGSIRFYVNTACFSVDFDNLLIIPLTNKTLKSISLPTETVDVPWGVDPDIQMTLNYGIYGTEEMDIFYNEDVTVHFDRYQVGEQTLIVQYGGKEASMKVKVHARSGIRASNFVVAKGGTPSFEVWSEYGPVSYKYMGGAHLCTGLDVNTPGRQVVTVTDNDGYSTQVIATVVEEEIYKYVDFSDVEDGTAPTGWNVTTFGTVTDGVFTTNGKTQYYMNGTRSDDYISSVAADFRLTNSQFNAFYDNVTTGKNTGYGVVRFGKDNGIGNALAFSVMFDSDCTPYLVLTGRHGDTNATEADVLVFAKELFTDFVFDKFINLEMKVYGNTVSGFVNGVERIRYTFDSTDYTVPEGRVFYSPGLYCEEVLYDVTRCGITANGAAVPNGIGIDVDVDNFLLRDVEAYYISTVAYDESGEGSAPAPVVNGGAEMALPGQWLTVEADVNSNSSLYVDDKPLFVNAADGFGGAGTTFGFTMPSRDVLVNMYVRPELSEGSYDLATVGTSIKEGYGLRFLNRLYLPRVYDGDKVVGLDLGDITEFGALIFPADLWEGYYPGNDSYPDIPLDIAAKAVAYSASESHLYDVTERYVDFSVVVKTNNTQREFVCVPYIISTEYGFDTWTPMVMSIDGWYELQQEPEDSSSEIA